METVVVSVILILLLGAAGWYVCKAKKNGRRCIGCPASGRCGKEGCGCCKNMEHG